MWWRYQPFPFENGVRRNYRLVTWQDRIISFLLCKWIWTEIHWYFASIDTKWEQRTRVLPNSSSCFCQSSMRGLIGPTWRELAMVAMLMLLSSSNTWISSVPPRINTSFESLWGKTMNSVDFHESSTCYRSTYKIYQSKITPCLDQHTKWIIEYLIQVCSSYE